MDKRIAKLDARDREIYRKWKEGTPTEQLAIEYRLTLSQVIHILTHTQYKIK